MSRSGSDAQPWAFQSASDWAGERGSAFTLRGLLAMLTPLFLPLTKHPTLSFR